MRLRRILLAVVVAVAVAVAVAVPAGGVLIGSLRPDGPIDDLIAALHVIVAPPPAIAAAEAEATRSCLRGEGFDPPLPAPSIYGTANLPWRPPDDVNVAFNQYVDALPADRRAIFDQALIDPASPRLAFTTPNGWAVRTYQGGCIAEARRRIYGSLSNWLLVYALPQDLNGIAADTLADSRVAPLWQRYVECRHETPSDTAACQAATGLYGTYMAEFDRRSAGWLRTHGDLTRKTAAVLHRAHQEVTRRG